MDESSVIPKLTIRRSFEIKEKRNAVTMIDELVSSGYSRRKACTVAGIPYLYYRHRKKLIAKIDGINDGKKFVSFNTKGTSRRIHQGRPSLLNGIEPQLKTFIFHVREQGRESGRKTSVTVKSIPSSLCAFCPMAYSRAVKQMRQPSLPSSRTSWTARFVFSTNRKRTNLPTPLPALSMNAFPHPKGCAPQLCP